MKPWFWSSGALLVGAMVGPVAAQTPAQDFELGWQAPGECPEENAFRSQVRRLAGHDAEARSELRAKVSIERSAETSYRLTLQTEFEGRSGTRTLEGSSCGAVVDAAALTLALILNPEAALDDGHQLVETTEPRVESTPVSENREPKPSSPGPRVRLIAGAGLGVQAGQMPSVAPDLAVGAGIAVGSAWGWLWGSATPEHHASVDDHPEAGGTLKMLSATALGCWDLVSSSPVLAPCLGAELNRLQGTGQGISDPQDAAIHWTSAAFGAAAQLELSHRFSLRFSALGLVPFSRPGLFLEGIGEVHRPDPVAIRADLGALVDFL